MNIQGNIQCIVVGPKSVGKTCLSQQFSNKQFLKDQLPSDAPESHFIPMQIHSVDLHCIPGEDFESLKEYAAKAMVAFCVFDLGDKQSQLDLEAYISLLEDHMPKPFFIVVIGNKSDLPHDEFDEESIQGPLLRNGAYKFYKVNAVQYGGLELAAIDVIGYFAQLIGVDTNQAVDNPII